MGSPLQPSLCQTCGGGREPGNQGQGVRSPSLGAHGQRAHPAAATPHWPKRCGLCSGDTVGSGQEACDPWACTGRREELIGHRGTGEGGTSRPRVMESVPLDQGARTINAHSRRTGEPKSRPGSVCTCAQGSEELAPGLRKHVSPAFSHCPGPRDGGEAEAPP